MISDVLDISGKEVLGGFINEYMRENFSDVNFGLIILAHKE